MHNISLNTTKQYFFVSRCNISYCSVGPSWFWAKYKAWESNSNILARSVLLLWRRKVSMIPKASCKVAGLHTSYKCAGFPFIYMFRISCHICLGFLVTRMRRISRLSRPIISLLPSLSPPSTPLIICRIIYTSLFKAAIIYQSMLWSQDLLPAPTAFIRARTIHTQCVTCATVPFSQSTHWSLFSNLSWQLRSLHRRWLEGIISRCHFTPACQWSSWSTWLELNQMIATGWSAFDCLIATSHVPCQCNVLYEL